jgi:glutaredoxin-like protein
MEDPDEHPVVVYWRPGCPFCLLLERGLRHSGLGYERRNIWDDPDAAAVVRLANQGNETVPTVVVGDRSLTNPSAGQVLAAVAEVAPEHLPEGWEPPTPGKVARLVTRVLGG